jgi:ferredoxin-NADP reductase
VPRFFATIPCMQLLSAEVTGKKQIAAGTLELSVRLIDPPAVTFAAGQFMEFKIGDSYITDRSYSIISLPATQNSELKFCIELIPGGVGSTFVSNLKIGDRFKMEGPFGIFTVKDFDHDAFFVATGVGVSPFVSMIPDMLARGFSRPVTLLFGARHETDILYKDFFDDLAKQHKNFNYIISLTQAKDGWSGLAGRVTSYLEKNYPAVPKSRYYICGGMEMVRDVRTLLLKLGQPHDEIALEVFD